MRKVTYFSAGLMAEFAITDTSHDKFLEYLDDAVGEINAYGEDDLLTARTILDNYMAKAAVDEDLEQGTGEVLAASFIWNFFNTHPEIAERIEGDIVILDVDGSLSAVEFVSAEGVQLPQDHCH